MLSYHLINSAKMAGGYGSCDQPPFSNVMLLIFKISYYLSSKPQTIRVCHKFNWDHMCSCNARTKYRIKELI